jgi:hypothetical protein
MDFKKQTIKPILFMVFNRPEKTARIWEEIRKAKPQKLYISADGPRLGNPDDARKCLLVREIVSDIDWQCNVKTLFHEENNGCSMAGKKAFDWVFSMEDEMIQLEDDVLPTQSFFWFMQEMLEKYKDDKRVCYICAENYGINSGDATYFFSQYGGSWGWGTWKRVYELWEYKLESLEETINTPQFRNSFLSNFQYNYWKRNFIEWKYKGGNTYDLQTIYLIHKENLVNVVPNINLVTNIGWDDEATNTLSLDISDKEAKKFGNVPSFEIEEIIHPKEIRFDPEVDALWFKYHFQGNMSEFSYRFRWLFASNFFNPIKVLLRPIYINLFK